ALTCLAVCSGGCSCFSCSTRSRAGPPKQILRFFICCSPRPGCAPNTIRQNSARLRFAGSPMLKLKRIFKNYQETGSLNEMVNLYGFVDSHMFLTKTGDLGLVLEVRGVDYEGLDGATLDSLTKRLESAFKLFDSNYRVYQYLFKRNHQTIPYKLYGKPVVDMAIKNRLEYFAGKADGLFSLSIYYVILFEGFRYTRTLATTLLAITKEPGKAVSQLRAHFSARKPILLLEGELSLAQ